jgi:exopolysaccharide biosynthesis predicted pyruvyltransferase EpsI
MENIHHTFLDTLLRFPSISELSEYQNTPLTHLGSLEENLLNTIEGQICLLVKRYEGIDVDVSNFNLLDFEEAMQYLQFVRCTFSKYVFKVPLVSDYVYTFTLLRLYGAEKAKQMTVEYILEQNEHKYLNECLTQFLTWPVVQKIHNSSRIKVRYYGPIGTSGYAIACRDIVKSLFLSETFDLEFVPLSIQNFNGEDLCEGNSILRTCCKANTTEDIFQYKHLEPVDMVFLHSFCDLWIPLVNRERRLNANTVIVGVTVWESDKIPPQWIPHLRSVDIVTVPNKWNRKTILNDVPNIKVTFLPHPVLNASSNNVPLLPSQTELKSLQELTRMKENGTYIFYTINEFSGRKGIDLLIKSFIEEFSGSENVVLFIKTHGSVSKTIGVQFLNYTVDSRVNGGKIVMDYERWTDAEIEMLHNLGDCYVSLTRAEGHGLAACHAALRGKHIVMTRYGGQVDYLRSISWVAAKSIPAFHCSPCDLHHQQCLNFPSCRDFPFFIAAQQNWGDPDVLQAKELMRRAFEAKLHGHPLTSSYLLNFNETSIAKTWTQFIEYWLQNKYHVPNPRAGLPNTYHVPPEQLLTISKFVHTKDAMFSNRPKVLLIGSWEYGNFGDDTYSVVHQFMMGNKYDIFFCNTTSYVDSQRVTRHLSEYKNDPLEVDHVVIGGGGLINEGELKSSIFKVYFPYCKSRNKPLSLISVGVAYPATANEATRVLSSNTITVWSELLQYAESVSVRSYADREAVKQMMPMGRHHRIHVASDVAYGLPTYFNIPDTRKRFVVYIPTNFLCLNFPDVAMYIQEQLMKYPGSRLVMIAMDGMGGNKVYPNKFIQEEIKKVQTLFPNTIILPGRYYWGATRAYVEKLLPSQPQEYADQTPLKVLSILRKAHVIITGRYHGVVMGRALNVPIYVGTCSLHKIQQEIREDLNPATWKTHYEYLFNVIDRCFQLGFRQDPTTWNEDQRNTVITDIVTNSKISAAFVQNMTNEQLSFTWDNIVLQRSDILHT